MTGAAVEHAARSVKPPTLQARLAVGDTDDPLEREADDIADRVMRMPTGGVSLLQRCPGGCPPHADMPPDEVARRVATTSAALDRAATVDAPTETAIRRRRGAGAPLPADLQALAERRLGADFSRVRLHADAHAAELARRVNARAFTVGADIFVGRGYHTGATDSTRLLVHELVHVVQQRAALAVQRQPAETGGAASVWATPAIDALAAGPAPPEPAEPYGPDAIVYDLYVAILTLHAALRETLTAGGGLSDEHRRLTDAVADTRSWAVAGFAMAIAEEVANGLLLLGDTEGADRVWSAARAAGVPAHERSDAAARAEFYLAAIRSWGGPPDDPAAALLRAGVVVHALEVVGRQLATLNPARGSAEKERERAIVAMQMEVLIRLFAHVQAVTDAIVAATHPDPHGALDLLANLLEAARPLVEPIWREEFAIIVADFASDPAVLRDFFSPEDPSLELAVEFYGEQPALGSAAEGLHAEVGTAIETRQQQVDLLRDLADQGMVSVGEEAVHPLSSDEALRAWTLQRFEELGGDAQALADIVTELDRYFTAFTIQAKQNVTEEDIPLVNAEFPQAATGELIHDCGIYAMRVLYALSLVGARLGLGFYTVRLPVHVAVVVTGPAELRARRVAGRRAEGGEVPLFVVHNGQFIWAVNEPTGPELERNVGAFAGGTFIPTVVDPDLADPRAGRQRGSVDVPYRVQEVLDPASQRGLQQAYDRLWILLPPDTDRDADDPGVVEESYLALLDAYRTFHNEGLRPLSEAVCDGWATVERTLFGELDVGAFLNRLRDAVARVRGRRDPLPGAARRLGIERELLTAILSSALGVDVGSREGRDDASTYFMELHERLAGVEEGAAVSLADAAALLGLEVSAAEALIRGAGTADPSAGSVAPALSAFGAAVSTAFMNVEPHLEQFRIASDELQSAVRDPAQQRTWGTMMAAAERLTFYDWMFSYKGFGDVQAVVRETVDLLASGRRSEDEAVSVIRAIIGGCSPLDALR